MLINPTPKPAKPLPTPPQNTLKRLHTLKAWLPRSVEQQTAVVKVLIPKHRRIAADGNNEDLPTHTEQLIVTGYTVRGWDRTEESKGAYRLWKGECRACGTTHKAPSPWFMNDGKCPTCESRAPQPMKPTYSTGNPFYAGHKPFTALYIFYAPTIAAAREEAAKFGYDWFEPAFSRKSHSPVWVRGPQQGDSALPIEEPPAGCYWFLPTRAPKGWEPEDARHFHGGQYYRAFRPPSLERRHLEALEEIELHGTPDQAQAAAAVLSLMVEDRDAEPVLAKPVTYLPTIEM